MTPPAGAILARLKSCDPKAAEDLFDLVFEKLFVYAAACTRTPEEAVELTQAVLSGAIAGLDDQGPVADEADLLAWLFQIARTRGADMYPRSAAPERPRGVPAEAGISDAMDAIRGLPRDERDVVVCHVLLGYDLDDTSRIARLSPERVARARQEALAKLESALEPSDAVA